MLTHVVHTNVHQLDRIERAAAEMRRGGGMRGAAVKGEVDAGVGERDRFIDAAPLEKAMYDQLIRLGPPPFDEADRTEAAKFQETLTDEDIASAFRRVGLPMRQGVSLCDQIVPLDAKSAAMVGSTDVGDVSWVVPTVQARGATYAIGTPGHSWQLTAQGKLPAAHKGLVHVAKVMAGTAIEVIQDEVLLARAKADHQARVSRTPYVCPLPDDLEPPVKMSA
jgi:aminobenzoyl-glutamate utilization protein B